MQSDLSPYSVGVSIFEPCSQFGIEFSVNEDEGDNARFF